MSDVILIQKEFDCLSDLLVEQLHKLRNVTNYAIEQAKNN